MAKQTPAERLVDLQEAAKLVREAKDLIKENDDLCNQVDAHTAKARELVDKAKAKRLEADVKIKRAAILLREED